MSLTIDSYEFDAWEGTIQLAKSRVAPYAASDRAYIGAQVLPTQGESFQFKTIRYDDANNRTAISQTLSAKIGTIVAIVKDGLSYATTYSQNFLVINVRHETIDVIPAHNGYRGSTLINKSPAGRVVSVWTLQAVPSS